ncbi:hypothetical protein [Pseudomonas shahriarae]
MKLSMTCMKCAFEQPANPSYQAPSLVEVRDDSVYVVTCKKGHTSKIILQEQKFEILFQIGAYAILDGYYREAVASFTSSLERFYEFFIRAKLLEEKCDDSSIESSWKHVAQQSERQLGAFIFLYTQTFGSPPEALKPNRVKFRNEVIHKGKIPTRQEATEYGQAVLDLIRPIMKLCKSQFSSGVDATVRNHVIKNGQLSASEQLTFMTIPTIINVSSDQEAMRNGTLIEELEALNINRAYWG